MAARERLDEIRRTIEERTRDLKDLIIHQRQRLSKQIDHHVQNLDEI
jgi:LPS O-antigen subunit length determinant protein (WzzB/FepE family)